MNQQTRKTLVETKPIGRRLLELATEKPDAPALTSMSASGSWQTLTRADLCHRVRATATAMDAAMDPSHGFALIDLPNGQSFFIAVLATWWSGRTPLIIPPNSTPEELNVLFAATGGKQPAPYVTEEILSHGAAATDVLRQPSPEREEGWYLPTGGSTGLPGLVPVYGQPASLIAGQQLLMSAMGWRASAVQLVLGPLFHAAPFTSSFSGIVGGNHIVAPPRFSRPDLEAALEIAHPTWLQLTPHHMNLIGADDGFMSTLSESLDGMMHTAAPCPEDVKRHWINRLGGHRVFEMYGSTQMIGAAICSGTDWLRRPGTVGRPFMTQVRILDERGRRLPPDTVGEVTMRSTGTRRMAASENHVRRHAGGYCGVGDLGYLDRDGYLFLTDRLDDVIIVGGANVSAREVEAVLLTHPSIREAIVVSRTHDLLGQTPYAVIACVGKPPSFAEVQKHCAQRLAPYKVPFAMEVVPELDRSRAEKIQRYKYTE